MYSYSIPCLQTLYKDEHLSEPIFPPFSFYITSPTLEMLQSTESSLQNFQSSKLKILYLAPLKLRKVHQISSVTIFAEQINAM